MSVVDYRVLDNAPHYDQVKAECTELVEDARDELNQAGLDAELVVRTAEPHRAILDYVSEHGIGLIMMGTHRRSSIERYLLGSVTEKTLRTSPAPVLTIRRSKSR